MSTFNFINELDIIIKDNELSYDMYDTFKYMLGNVAFRWLGNDEQCIREIGISRSEYIKLYYESILGEYTFCVSQERTFEFDEPPDHFYGSMQEAYAYRDQDEDGDEV